MRRIFSAVFGLSAILVGSAAQAVELPYAFEKFPTMARPAAKPVPLKLGGFRDYRTAIRRGIAEGPNFAGDKTIVLWGCGTSCQNSVLYDPATGGLTPIGTTQLGLSYRKDSDLLVLNPADTDDVDASSAKTEFLRWDGRTLTPVSASEASAVATAH